MSNVNPLDRAGLPCYNGGGTKRGGGRTHAKVFQNPSSGELMTNQIQPTEKPAEKPKALVAQTGDPFANSTSDLLMRARCKLLTLNPWYGTMASMFRWKPVNEKLLKTIGVRVVDGGYVDCLYNSEFCNQLNVDEMMSVVQHEIEHIVRLHCVRVGQRDARKWNHATDFTINGKESNPHIKGLPNKEDLKGIYYPEKWDDNMTSEELYDRLQKTRIRYKGAAKAGCQPSPEGRVDGDDIVEGPNDATEEIVVEGQLDDHDVWAGSTVGEDEARQVVKDMVRQAGLKAGSVPGHLLDAISQLEQPCVNWKYELRQFMGRAIGGKRRTWSRANRRRPEFGIKGKSNHASVKLTIGVDTSGSVSQKLLDQFFSELEMMSQKFKITLVQFDHGYQRHDNYHRGDWKRIPIQGRGGTSFTEFFKAIEEKKLVGKCNLILSDGEAPFGEERPYPVLWVIMPHGAKEHVTPTWGKYIFIEK